MSETVISGVTLRIGSWQVFPAGDLLPEAAAEYFSAPEDIPDGYLESIQEGVNFTVKSEHYNRITG